MTKNQKIGIALGIAAILGYILYKKNEATETKAETTSSTTSVALPIVEVSSGSETPQVVNIPPQFGGAEVVTANVPTTAGSWQSFN